jgi:hypothetical protein
MLLFIIARILMQILVAVCVALQLMVDSKLHTLKLMPPVSVVCFVLEVYKMYVE